MYLDAWLIVNYGAKNKPLIKANISGPVTQGITAAQDQNGI